MKFILFLSVLLSFIVANEPIHLDDKKESANYSWELVATGLNHPWGVEFLGDDTFVITERVGAIRIVKNSTLSKPLRGVLEVAVGGQGGLLDIKLDENFKENRTLYLCFSEFDKSGKNSTALISAKLGDGELTDVKKLFTQLPRVNSRLHFGCRIALKDEQIYLTLGERYSYKDEAQNLSNHLGKIIRINKDGSVPKDNPFVATKNAKPEIYSYGHRNIQGVLFDDKGRLWINEHGPQGGDEINIVEKGRNYGWPVITYGENYGGGKIGEGVKKDGMEQPIFYYKPSIATSGITFVTTDKYGKEWKGNLLVGALKEGYVSRLKFDGNGKFLGSSMLLVGERVRDVKEAPNGEIYIITDQSDGNLYRLKVE